MSLFVKDSLNSTTLMCGSHDNSLLASPQPSEEKKHTENRQNSGSTLNRVFCSTLKDFKDFKDVVEFRDSAELSAPEQEGGDTS